MPKNNDDNLLNARLASLKPLDEVPQNISVNFHTTISQLVAEHEKSHLQKKRSTKPTSFSIAAGIFVFVILGSAVTINLNQIKPNSGNANSVSSTAQEEKSSAITQYSNSNVQNQRDLQPIRILSSETNYRELPQNLSLKYKIESVPKSIENINNKLRACLDNLQLSNQVSVIDKAYYSGQMINAAWVPLDSNSWHVYVINRNCEVLDKIFVTR